MLEVYQGCLLVHLVLRLDIRNLLVYHDQYFVVHVEMRCSHVRRCHVSLPSVVLVDKEVYCWDHDEGWKIGDWY